MHVTQAGRLHDYNDPFYPYNSGSYAKFTQYQASQAICVTTTTTHKWQVFLYEWRVRDWIDTLSTDCNNLQLKSSLC